MAQIVLRAIKGQPLTIAEADANFNNLNTELGTKLTAVDYNAADVLAKLLTVGGSGSGLDADLVDGMNATSSNTPTTVVSRNASGNFSAGIITASLVGNVTGNVTGNLVGTVTGNASNVSGIVQLLNGGTGATSASSARTNLGLGTISTQDASNVAITGGTISGITALGIASGGTGATSALQARINLGVNIGGDVQAFSSELSALAAQIGTGLYVRTSTNSYVQRAIVVGTNGLTISNGDGISGNPTLNISTTAALTIGSLSVGNITSSGTISVSTISKSGSNGIGDIGQSDNRYGTIYGTATSAKYADLAEKYTTDKEYETGTVIVVSLDESGAEGTASFLTGQRVLGVVSAKPAYLMNDEAPGQALALRGRVPVKVVGAIKKGQSLIAGPDGKAVYSEQGNVFAIALHSSTDPGVKLVECVIL